MADLRIGIVGTGMIGRTHIERINTKLQGDVSLLALMQISTSANRLPKNTGSRLIAPARK